MVGELSEKQIKIKALSELHLPHFFPLFANGLGKPLSMASSGQASDG